MWGTDNKGGSLEAIGMQFLTGQFRNFAQGAAFALKCLWSGIVGTSDRGVPRLGVATAATPRTG
jgi:hypothetical protein